MEATGAFEVPLKQQLYGAFSMDEDIIWLLNMYDAGIKMQEKQRSLCWKNMKILL